MAKRWKVLRAFVRFKDRTYYAGELLPEYFTERDMARNIHGRRLVQVEIPDGPSVISKGVKPIKPKKEEEVPKEDKKAATHTTTTGTKAAKVTTTVRLVKK